MIADAGLLDINGTFLVEVIAFLVLLAILSKWVYPLIIKTAEARQDQIEEALKAAEQSRTATEKALAEVKKELTEAKLQAREIVDHAKREAVTEVSEIREKAREDAHKEVQQARSEIAAEKQRVMQELRAEVGTLVVTAAGKVLGQSIDQKTHEKLITESLQQVSAEKESNN